MVKSLKVEIRVTEAQKDMIEFMAQQNGLSKSAYLIMLATKDFNNSQFRKYPPIMLEEIKE